jgi:hypothetical protein
MSPDKALQIINKTVKLDSKLQRHLEQCKHVYYGMSLHMAGITPRFTHPITRKLISPPCYDTPYQYLFDNVLLNRHPREPEELRDYRYSQYRPMTKAPFNQVTEITAAALFQDSNYTLTISDPDDSAYIWDNNFDGYDLIQYFANKGIKYIMEDPNGFFVYVPKYSLYEAQAMQGKLAIDIWFVYSKDIIYTDPTGKSLIFYKDQYVYLIDDRTIWRFTQKELNSKTYVVDPNAKDGYYAHMFGKVPASKAGGVWNTQGYYDSYLDKAKAAADDYISAYSAKQLVDKEAAHPFIIEADTECPECHGKGQVQIECETCPTGLDLRDCGECGGSGTISRNPGQRIIAPKEDMDKKLIQIVNPDTSVNKNAREAAAEIMTLILEALHLKVVDEAQSGVAKAIDQERLYQFLSNISNHVFGSILYDFLTYFTAYRNVTVANGRLTPKVGDFTLIKPNQFQIKTAADLLEDYKTGMESNLPAFLLVENAKLYADKYYSGNEVILKKTDVIMQLDTLAVRSVDQIQSMVVTGSATKEMANFNRELPFMLDKLIERKGKDWFVKADIEAIEKELPAMATTPQQTTNTMQVGGETVYVLPRAAQA